MQLHVDFFFPFEERARECCARIYSAVYYRSGNDSSLSSYLYAPFSHSSLLNQNSRDVTERPTLQMTSLMQNSKTDSPSFVP